MEWKLNNPIAQRSTKTVYKEDGKTIKLFVENYSKADILNEALNHVRVEEGTNLKVPKLIAVTKINDRWALILEHIEGTPLDQLMQKFPEKEEEYLNQLIDLQLEVLGNRVSLLNEVKEKLRRKINTLEGINDHTKYELLERLNSMKTHDKLCHGDFNPSNIIIKDNGDAYIIDWAHVTKGNASADAARTFLLFSIEGKRLLAEKYLNLFSTKSGIDKSLIQRWIPIVAAEQMTRKNEDEQELLGKWIDIVDYQ